MIKAGLSRAEANKAIRQEALRDQLAAGGHLQHVVDIAKQLSEIETPLEPTEVVRLKSAADIKLKLINKYLPDLKITAVVGEGDQENKLPSAIQVIYD